MLAFLLVAVSMASANVRVNINLGAGHPIHRPRTVIVHRAPVVVGPRVVYAPPVMWTTRAIVALPPRERMVWEDSETLQRREDWVDTFLNVNNTGDALFLRVNGRAQVDFVEVHFRNGQVQVVDFNESELRNGVYLLLDFANGRYVEHVRLVGRSISPRSNVTVMMKK